MSDPESFRRWGVLDGVTAQSASLESTAKQRQKARKFDASASRPRSTPNARAAPGERAPRRRVRSCERPDRSISTPYISYAYVDVGGGVHGRVRLLVRSPERGGSGRGARPVELLQEFGPGLGRPPVDNVHQGAPRSCSSAVTRAPTTRRAQRLYDQFVPIADNLYDDHSQSYEKKD